MAGILKKLTFIFFYTLLVISNKTVALTPPVSDVQSVIEVFEDLEATLWEIKDHRVIFTQTYLEVTKQIEKDLSHGVYENPEWVKLVIVQFAKKYLSAFYSYQERRFDQVPRAWRISFNINKRKNYKVTAQLLLAMNAHIYYDLPLSLNESFSNGFVPDNVKRDYELMNRMFKNMIPKFNKNLKRLFDHLYPNEKGLQDFMVFKVLEEMRYDAWGLGLELYEARGIKQVYTIVKIRKNSISNANLILRGHFFYPRY